MGVKDLWTLLKPYGRRINVETLEGKVLTRRVFVCGRVVVVLLSPVLVVACLEPQYKSYFVVATAVPITHPFT
jgi:hypothetical protein